MPDAEIRFPKDTITIRIGACAGILGALCALGASAWVVGGGSALPQSWAAITGGVLVGIVIFLAFRFWANANIRFTDVEVTKPGIFKPCAIRWSDVTSVVHRGGGVCIHSQTTKVAFSPHVFKEPEKVLKFIEAHISTTRM